MDVSTRAHPRFGSPPIVETVFSIEFAPIERLTVPFFGLYWAKIRDRYPRSAVHSAIPSQIEDFSGDRKPASGVSVSIDFTPAPRCWFFNDEETRLIQLQSDRFIFNWKPGLPSEPYPHYENIRPILMREWQEFSKFADMNELGSRDILQCEVTYINHLELGLGWNNYGEISNVLSPWSGATTDGVLPAPEDISLRVRYRMPEKAGRLHINVLPAIRPTDQKEVLQLTITARSGPVLAGQDDVFRRFDQLQDWAAKGFLDFTTQKIHSLWDERID